MLALIACLWVAPAAADEPIQVETISVRGWSAGDYNDYLVAISDEVWAAFLQVDAAGLVIADDASLEQQRQAYTDVLEAGIARMEAVPPYRGDSALRDACLDRLYWHETDLGPVSDEIWEIWTKETATNADLQRAEDLGRRRQAQMTALDEAVHAAQSTFAGRWGFWVDDGNEFVSPTGPVFEHEGLPPDGSVLNAAAHVGFAIRYDFGILGSQNRTVEALDVFWGQVEYGAPDKHEGYRLEALEVLRREQAGAEALGDWQGDASYRDALVAYTSGYVELFEGDVVEYLELWGKRFLFRKKRARLETLGEETFAEETRLEELLLDAMNTFRERWGIHAWDRFVREHEGERIGD